MTKKPTRPEAGFTPLPEPGPDVRRAFRLFVNVPDVRIVPVIVDWLRKSDVPDREVLIAALERWAEKTEQAGRDRTAAMNDFIAEANRLVEIIRKAAGRALRSYSDLLLAGLEADEQAADDETVRP